MFQLDENGGVLELCLQAPPTNCIGSSMIKALQVFLSTTDFSTVKVLIIRSNIENVFCSGADLRELHQRIKEINFIDYKALASFIDDVHAVMDSLDTLPVVSIAVVNGICFGGGFELALTADIIIAEQNARFGFPELRLGIIPTFGGIPRLRRNTSETVVNKLIYTGVSLNAQAALDTKIITDVTKTDDGLDRARSLANQIVKYDKSAITASKNFMKKIPTQDLYEEKQTFLQMVQNPNFLQQLTAYINNDGLFPHLPK